MRLIRTLALLVAAGLGAGYVESVARVDSGARLQELRRLREELQVRLAAGVGRDPIAAQALADQGEIVIAVRAGLIEDLIARMARQYLQKVTVDLKAYEAHAQGRIKRKTPIGRKALGEWTVAIVVEELVGQLRAGQPRLTFASNRLDVELPLEVQPGPGRIGLHFAWDSTSVVNLVCKDFALDLEVEGRTLRQEHVLRGQIELAADNARLTATPIVTERSFALQLELTPDSWGKIESAVRAQDSLARCGLFMDPDHVLAALHELVAKGLTIKLPRSIFRPVQLPASFEHSVQVNDSPVQLSLTGERLHSNASMLWSSTQVSVSAAPVAQVASTTP